MEKILRNGKKLILGVPFPLDAYEIIQYINQVGGESDHLLFGAGEFHLSVEQEEKFIRDMNQNNNARMVVGKIDKQIVSVGVISCPNRKRIHHNAELSLSVKKEFWNLGVGSAVLNELILFASDHHYIKNIQLGVKVDNIYAIKLYKKFGFVEVGLHKNYINIDGKFIDLILMDLYLK